MRENGWADDAEIDSIRADVQRDVDAAVEWAGNSPYPEAADAFRNVYEEQ
jgi:TPP-dependent pyruvate/acetoin dehydrogenase alpha subunit